jgi:hypothetical protein
MLEHGVPVTQQAGHWGKPVSPPALTALAFTSQLRKMGLMFSTALSRKQPTIRRVTNRESTVASRIMTTRRRQSLSMSSETHLTWPGMR